MCVMCGLGISDDEVMGVECPCRLGNPAVCNPVVLYRSM